MTRKEEYAAYLNSAHWKAFKAQKLAREPKVCAACRSLNHVQLHHMKYRDTFEQSKLDDTCWLCRDCHSAYHAKARKKLKSNQYGELLAITLKIIRGDVVCAPKPSKTPEQRAARLARRAMRRAIKKQQKLNKTREKVLAKRDALIAVLPVDPKYYEGKKVSFADQAKFARSKGGYTKATLKSWGVEWPPMKGWQSKLHRGLNPNI